MNTEIPTRRYFVAVRSWFDRENGNSYWTAQVWDSVADEKVILSIRYGSNYLPDAGKVLGVEMDWRNAVLDVAYVSRKKDLHFAGKSSL